MGEAEVRAVRFLTDGRKSGRWGPAPYRVWNRAYRPSWPMGQALALIIRITCAVLHGGLCGV